MPPKNAGRRRRNETESADQRKFRRIDALARRADNHLRVLLREIPDGATKVMYLRVLLERIRAETEPCRNDENSLTSSSRSRSPSPERDAGPRTRKRPASSSA